MAKEVKIKVGGETSKYERSMRNVKRSTRKMTQSVEKSWTSAAKKIGGALGMITAGYGIKALTSELLSSASDLEEAANKFGVVFKGQVQKAESWATILVDAYAMSRREAKQYLSSVQDLLVPMGMQAGAAGQLSNEIVKLSADLGSFNNLGTAQVMGDIQSALVGNYETMKKYGVVLNATIVQEEALAMGLANTKKQLTAGDKAQASYKLMVEGSKAAIGDMARTSGGYANQIKQLKANFENLSATMGSELLPIATDVVKQINSWVRANENLLKQKVSAYVDGIKKSLKSSVDIYNALPAGLISATGYGLVGGLLFGGQAGVIIGAIALLNTQLKSLNLNLGSLADKYKDLNKATGNIWDVITGKRDWRTGQEIGPLGGPIFRGKMPARPEAAPIVPVVGGAGAGQPEPWEHAKSIAEQIVNSWNEVISESETLGLSYFFRREQGLLEEARQQELERLRTFGEQRIELNQWEHDAAIHMMQQRQAEELRIEEYTAKAKIQAQMNYMTATMNIGRAIQAFTGRQSKTIFGIMKAVEVGKATMAAFSASTLALANPPGPPWTIPLSKSVLMMGLANAAAIAATAIGQMTGAGGAGMGAISTGAVPSAPVPYASSDVALSREVRATTNIYIQGDFIGEETWIDYLIEKLNQAGEARDVYIYASHARTAEELGY